MALVLVPVLRLPSLRGGVGALTEAAGGSGTPGAAPTTPTYMASFWLRASARLLLLRSLAGARSRSTAESNLPAYGQLTKAGARAAASWRTHVSSGQSRARPAFCGNSARRLQRSAGLGYCAFPPLAAQSPGQPSSPGSLAPCERSEFTWAIGTAG